jgi:parallel beta-helix repeat protein
MEASLCYLLIGVSALRKLCIFTLIALFALSCILFCPNRVDAQYSGSIAINSDGTFSPSMAPIEKNGKIYTLTSSVIGTITVTQNDLILDGNGFTISGGLSLNSVSNITIRKFIVTGGLDTQSSVGVVGILLNSVSNSLITNNTIAKVWDIQAMNAACYTGLIVDGGGSNTIIGNTFFNNYLGMFFHKTTDNFVFENSITVEANTWNLYSDPGGVFFNNASNNSIFHNNFYVFFGAQSGNLNSVNNWDAGYPAGGNYWSNYKSKYPIAKEIDDSGIGNKSYVIDSQNKDHYPLMSPFNYNSYLFRTSKPQIELLLQENQTYFSGDVAFNFTIDKNTSWIGYSLDHQENVTINGNFTITNLANGEHNLAIYANDTFGNMGVQSSNFTVDQSAQIPVIKEIMTQLLIIITVAIVITIITLLFYRRYQRVGRKNLTNHSPKITSDIFYNFKI